MIRLEQVGRTYGEREVVFVERLEIAPGQRVGLEGPNGCGKSTLLRLLARLERPSRGRLTSTWRPGEVVLVHQQPWFFRGTVRDNLLQGRHFARRPSVDAEALLEQLGGGGLLEAPAKTLSGGERARVALARALSVRPACLLLDEPFVALDADGVRRARDLLADFGGALVLAAPDLGEDTFATRLRLPAPATDR